MADAIAIYLVNAEQLQIKHSDSSNWCQTSGFSGKAGTVCLVPDVTGKIAKVLVGEPDTLDTWTLAELPKLLPAGSYTLADTFSNREATKLYLGWQLGSYSFDRYKLNKAGLLATLQPSDGVDMDYVTAATEATYLVRDLVTTPANNMGPEQLEETSRSLAERYDATVKVIAGGDLVIENYPMIYAVGKASTRAPRLIDIHWGSTDAPQVTLVGKGVCFDSGGLDVKSATGMRLMKKDMGGAAQVLGLAQMIMAMDLPVHLRVLIAAVENSIAGNALRPLDILTSRKGTTVEIGNTDAEGRLVLADALWEASSEEPNLLIDCATLTGAARVALGTELPAFFCNHDATTAALLNASRTWDDLLWNLPLHHAYRSMLDSPVADINNIAGGSYGGAITAALFLQEFIQPNTHWIHVDFMAYNLRSLPGRPEGGDAMGMRALFELIKHQVTPQP
ncbi:leucyl aminopeptidase family protein [Leptolyngbya cf. ectocarpi LEGE 11479]|uniref:Probable cytosol aminopeptidase n=1 Tax=Leptolyngbya cf. ectocarpi LEGE 11479 TaxID=1828722 RepID=A0A928ZTG3_LEPEC|nr:leucyl aminopeptidase family protein [Leptolyngbya ectocarpi]MBE9065339.1 leucyl aminopeptidase family protein [Leptolyngbya cf. ectocarpi LEGE 11479]